MKFRCLIILLVSVALWFCGCSSLSYSSSDTTRKRPTSYNPPSFSYDPIEIPDYDMDKWEGDATYIVSYTAHLSYNNHVGNSWGYGVKYDGEYIESGSCIEVPKIMRVPITAYASEFDSYNDYGSSYVYFDSLDVGEKQTEEVTVVVSENRGRYSGNTAGWTFTITIERTS